MMHAYWMRDPALWRETVVRTRYSTTMESTLDATNPFGEEQVPIPDPDERAERERAVAWSNGRALYDQCHRKARAHGMEAAEALQGLLQNVLSQLSRNTLPGHNTDHEQPLPVSLRTSYGPAISSEGPNLVVHSVGNPNRGSRRQRFPRRRRSWTERVANASSRSRRVRDVPVTFPALSGPSTTTTPRSTSIDVSRTPEGPQLSSMRPTVRRTGHLPIVRGNQRPPIHPRPSQRTPPQ